MNKFEIIRDDDLFRNREMLDLKLQESVKEIEDKLKRMGFERPRSGPRISDPAHTRSSAYSYLKSSA